MDRPTANFGYNRIGPAVFSPNLDGYHAVFERNGKRYIGFGTTQEGDYDIMPEPVEEIGGAPIWALEAEAEAEAA